MGGLLGHKSEIMAEAKDVEPRNRFKSTRFAARGLICPCIIETGVTIAMAR
jgi:hypothetical protein